MLKMIIYCNYNSTKGFGAGLSYYENSKILSRQSNALGLSLSNILRKIKDFKDEDTLLTNLGPYAWIFHYYRKKHDKNFSIIRDVHTTLWSGYLLQEDICSDYSNENDKLMFASEFTRRFYMKLFPHLNEENTFVSQPIKHFPNKQEIVQSKDKDEIVLGWLGTPSKEKNFDQALQIFMESYKSLKDMKIKFIVCGNPLDEHTSEKVIASLKKNNIDPSNYIHLNNGKTIPHQGVWDFLKNIDILLFPSTANIESCPRVLSEANHMGIPIIASEHGGGYNIVPKENLVKTIYFEKSTDLINNQPLGKIDVDEAVEKIASFHKLKINKDLINKDHTQKFLALLHNRKIREHEVLDSKTKSFIKNTKLFLNKNYKRDISKAINIFLNSNQYDIGNTAYKLAKGLNFKVHAKFK